MMRILKQPTAKFKYALNCPYTPETLNFCRSLKNQYGYPNFGYEFKSWRFNDLRFLSLIKQRFPEVTVDINMQEDVEGYEREANDLTERLQRAEQLKETTSSSLVIEGIKGNMYPYQKVAVEFFVNNNGRAILDDTMGLGKSLSALGYVVHQKMQKTLVICPASVKYSWHKEVKKWTDLEPYVINSNSDLTVDVLREYQVFIINYDILKKFFPLLSTYPWDCLICDEFHYIKNISAQRTKLTMMLARKAPHSLLLSGTPLLSRPVELFTGLQVMDPLNWSNWYSYTSRYCQGHRTYFGWDARGASNIRELSERINRYFLRRTKEEVLRELPPKRLIDIPVQLDEEYAKKYLAAESSFIEYLKWVKRKTDKEIKRSLSAEKLVKLGELRQLASFGKVEPAKEIIQNIIDGEEKVVVYCSYNEPLRQLKEHFGDQAVLLLGDVDVKERQRIIVEFHENPKVKVFLGGIKSAGVGITLTAASNVLFLDYSWTPADHAQAADRIHRIGQTAASVAIYQMYSINTIDEYMRKLLGRKQVLFDILIEGKDNEYSQTNMMTDLIKHYDNSFIRT